MLSSSKRLARHRLDEKLAAIDRTVQTPSRGWLRTIRDALGMNGTQFARRLGVAWQSMDDLEKSEASGTIRLDTLRRAAAALDCTLVYVLVPNSPLETMVDQRARAIAATAVDRVDQTMTLEDQRVTRDERDRLIAEYIRDHVRDRDIWEER